MSSRDPRTFPSDQPERERALDATRSALVQAPAGSGKTDLLARRFLRLLGEVDDPKQIVAITFTIDAAAEMRHRILENLEKAAEREGSQPAENPDEFSMEALAGRALRHSRERGWNLIDLPAQLRIQTIDAFCRELALQQPLLSELGGGLDIAPDTKELYRRAARRTLERIDAAEPELRASIEALLLWRDNGWQEMENLFISMLGQRDRWMRDFALKIKSEREWNELREWLERPFASAARAKLERLSAMLDAASDARTEALALARFACGQLQGAKHRSLAELAEFPRAPFDTAEELEEAREASAGLAELFLTSGHFLQRVDKRHGFPADARAEKARLLGLIGELKKVDGLEDTLAAAASLPPARYTEDDWRIVRACFALLRQAAGELTVVFAEAAAVDYIEVAQTAQRVLKGVDGIPDEATLKFADDIRHLLVDEFQDTSRRQHELLRRLIAAWPEREGRTCFVVGDPMQSIYSFRDADAELFSQVKNKGLEIPGEEQPFGFDSVTLTANFRTAPPLVTELNHAFERVFAADDGSGVRFAPAKAEREPKAAAGLRLVAEERPLFNVHAEFMPAARRGRSSDPDAEQKREQARAEREAAQERQIEKIIDLIRSHEPAMEAAQAAGQKYRIAVLGRARKALAPIAEALRKAGIAFRAVDLEELKERPEVLDALSLTRALLNPQDRVAWLGVLRAPWCGLPLNDLHTLTSGDDPERMRRAVPELLVERLPLIGSEGKSAVERVLRAMKLAAALRSSQPMQLGAWVEQAWLALGGAACVDAAARANLNLLWSRLDALPDGEQDALGSALDAAIEDLKALPDPTADSECGVLLMTVHGAKGLEFEVVIVPELQAGTGRGDSPLLAWMERGLDEPDERDEAAEFLVAPIQSKGAERGTARAWVDAMRRERETQEARRLLYVAATRAREELHLFARPEYRTAKDGALELATPANCLLATAWPAVEDEVQRQFSEWVAGGAEPGTVDIAAEGAKLLTMPAAGKPARLRRLPVEFEVAPTEIAASAAESVVGGGSDALYRRHEGGLLSRALGRAAHTLLEEMARLRQSREWDAVRAALQQMEGAIAAEVRSAGVDRSQAARIAAEAMEIALAASRESQGQWILSPHAEAASETRWAGVVEGSLRTVQVDRVFRAGLQPLGEGDEAWWIVDYKTAHASGLDPEKALPELRRVFAPQLEAYARVLRNLRGAEAKIIAGLYYPRMRKLDCWEM